MKIFGEEQGDLDTKKAQELGVAIIHQELNMCRHLTVAKNIFLGHEVRKVTPQQPGNGEADAGGFGLS